MIYENLPRVPFRRLLSFLVLALVSVSSGLDVEAQCQVLSGPTEFAPSSSLLPSYMRKMAPGSAVSGPGRRLVTSMSYGYLVYSLQNPGTPAYVGLVDLFASGYPKYGDGQSRTGPTTISTDGSRMGIPWTEDSGHGIVVQQWSGTGFGPGGGDFGPSGSTVNQGVIAKVGSRYLGFSADKTRGLFVGDVTNAGSLPGASLANGIPSEVISGTVTNMRDLDVVETPAKTWVVGSTFDGAVYIVDVSTPGTSVPFLSSAFTVREVSKSQLGAPAGTWFFSSTAAAHPMDGSLHVLAQFRSKTAPYLITLVTLNRINPATGAVELVGSFVPPSDFASPNQRTLLLPFDSELVTFLLLRGNAPQYNHIQLQARSSSDFATNLAATVPVFTTWGTGASLQGFRSSGGNVHLYWEGGVMAALSLGCTTTALPAPATAILAVDRMVSGSPVAVPSGGDVFIGEQLRIRPAFTPPDSVQPLLEWRLDFNFHEQNPADQGTTGMRLNADVSGTSPSLPNAEYTLFGPCDPKQVPEGGSAPNPATGEGCWTSVTTNGDLGEPLGTPDFSGENPGERVLKVAFDVRNALNSGSSWVAHGIRWKVPQQKLKNASILSGGALEDGSDGTPATTGLNWYFASVPFGTAGDDVLTLKADCTGPVCNPGLQAPGNYRYWVSAPYRGGFRTPECPGLAEGGTTCTGSEMKTFAVTDVVLSLTAPTQSLVGNPTVSVTSTSKKGSVVEPCLTTTGFQYHFCQVSGGSCEAPPEQDWLDTGLTVSNPFPSSGSGTITLPNQPVGTWGLRIRYAYETGGGCADRSVATWPATGYSQLVVTQSVPSIRLRNSTDTADIPKSMGIYWELATGQTARAYAELNGVRDTNPPTGLAWSYRLDGGTSETPLGAAQGASFSIATAGDYEVILRGYGDPVYAKVGVTSGGGTPPPTGPPTVSSVTPSTYSPALGQIVNFTCNATQGSASITSYDWVLEAGVTRTTTSSQTSYAYATAGTKTFSCTANDSAGQSSSTRVASLTVSGGGGGVPSACSLDILDPVTGARISFDSAFQLYEAPSGKVLRFVARDVTTTVSWNFGDGTTGSGAPFDKAYVVGSTAQEFTVRMTSGTCSPTAKLSVFPSSGGSSLDFSVSDAGTDVLLDRVGATWQAISGQLLKFTAVGATGALGWSFGDGTTGNVSPLEKAYTTPTDATYTVTLTNGTATKQYTVFVKGSTGAPLTGTYTFKYADGTTVNRAAVTPNKAIRFTAADQATTYTWDFGDGSPLATGSPRDHSFTRGGSFSVKLTVSRTGVTGSVTTPTPLAFNVTEPPDPLLWVAGGMVYADGSGGARWQSDLSIHNPGTGTATVSIGFVLGAGWEGNGNVNWIPRSLVPGETLSYQNILSTFFGLGKGAWGVVLVRGDSVPAPPVIVSRTYNAANLEEAGTYGLSVPAISVAGGVKPQSGVGGNFLAGLRHDAAFRTNLTVANLKSDTAEVEVIFRDASGSILGSPAKITVEPGGVKQLNAALSAPPAVGEQPIGGAGWTEFVSHFSAEVRLKRGSGVYPYATVIDQGTGDAIVVTPAPRPSSTYRLPGIVRVKGQAEAYWVSDVAILNPTGVTRRVRVNYSYANPPDPSRNTREKTITLAPWETKVYVDFVREWLGLAAEDAQTFASSYVDVFPAPDDADPTAPLVVNGKTYTLSERGSVGLQVDAFVYEDGMTELSSRRKLVLSGLEKNDGYRTNVALFLTPGSTGSIQVTVRVLNAFGLEVKKITEVGLNDTAPVVQLNSDFLFSDIATSEVARASVVIENPRGGGHVGAYATIIDNKSGDATFVAGQPAP